MVRFNSVLDCLIQCCGCGCLMYLKVVWFTVGLLGLMFACWVVIYMVHYWAAQLFETLIIGLLDSLLCCLVLQLVLCGCLVCQNWFIYEPLLISQWCIFAVVDCIGLRVVCYTIVGG